MQRKNGKRQEMKKQRRERIHWLLLFPFFIFYVILVFFPLLGLIQKSFVAEKTIGFELFEPAKLASVRWTAYNYSVLFAHSYYQRMIINTLIVCAVSVAVMLVFGTLISYLLAQPGIRGRRIIEWFVSLPMFLSGVVASYALFLVLGRTGILAAVTTAIFKRPLSLTRTFTAVIVGTSYIILPLFVRTVRPGFEAIRMDLFEASFSLGANELQTFLRIALPLALPAILAGTVISFTYVMGLVVVALILGPTPVQFPIMPLEILERAKGLDLNIPLASAMSVVLTVVAFAGQIVVERFLRRIYK